MTSLQTLFPALFEEPHYHVEEQEKGFFCAFEKEWEGGMPVGQGPTAFLAIQDLREQLDEKDGIDRAFECTYCSEGESFFWTTFALCGLIVGLAIVALSI